jgi:small subunit ribosomal protein S18
MNKSRSKNKDNARRAKKKTSILNTESVKYVDWKDVNLLRRFMSDRAKVRARRVTGNNAQQQREVAKAIKNAREMALLPYVTRITQQRGARGDKGDRGDRGDRGPRGDRDDRPPRGDREDRAPREGPPREGPPREGPPREPVTADVGATAAPAPEAPPTTGGEE